MSSFDRQSQDILRDSIRQSVEQESTSNNEQQQEVNVDAAQAEPTTVEKESGKIDQNFSEENNSPDIANGSEEQSSDDPIDNLLNNTFKGDPKKVAKSYLESQRAYTELQSKYGETSKKAKELESHFSALDSILAQYPSLAKQVEKAIRGEYAESQNVSPTEPAGKPQQATQGKLDSTDTLPTEQTLIDRGYIKPEDKQTLSTLDYDRKLLEAQIRYAREDLPKTLAEQSRQQYLEMQRQDEEQKQKQQINQTNNQRFSESFDRAVARYGLDFTSTHASLKDEIVNAVKAFRDPENMNLLLEDAVELAAERVLKKHDMLPKAAPKQAPQQTQQPMGDDGFNSNKAASVQSKRNDFTSKYEERLNQLQMSDIQRRNQNRVYPKFE